MELGAHIKEHRKEKGLSQDDLAEKIYVSRQTISNWETGRTYPDVQSLLLLSNVFEVTVDSLIKGDVEAMAKAMDEAVKKYNALSTAAVVSGVVFLVLAAWGAFQYEWGWGMHMVPCSPSLHCSFWSWRLCMLSALRSSTICKRTVRYWRSVAESASIATRSRVAASGI